MNGYGKHRSSKIDVNMVKMMVNNEFMWFDTILQLVLHRLFHDVSVPIKQQCVMGGYVPWEEIDAYVGGFMYEKFEKVIPNLSERTKLLSHEDNTPTNRLHKLFLVVGQFKIPIHSVKEYLEYLITLEEKYPVDSSNVAHYKEMIQIAEDLQKEKEEREKKEAEEKERIRVERMKKKAEEEERIRIENEKRAMAKKEAEERKKAEEEAKAFELEVQRRVKLELYERRVRAEVERRLKALDDVNADIMPVEEAVVQAMEVKEEVKKPLSILERFKGLF